MRRGRAEAALMALAGILLAGAAFCSPAVPLGKAAEKGSVSLDAKTVSGYESMCLSILNLRDEPVTLDFFGSRFVPRQHAAQPLGVPRIELDCGGTSLTLPPRGRWTGSVPSFCLDANASAPGSGVAYVIVLEKVADTVQIVFKHWNHNPDTDQDEIQRAVWDGESSAVVIAARTAMTDPLASPGPNYVMPNRPYIAVLGGIDYVLGTDGRLFEQDNLSLSGRESRQVGRGLCALYSSGDRLWALQKTDDTGAYSVLLKNGEDWKNLGSIYSIPEHAAMTLEGAPLFLTQRKVLSLEHDDRSLVRVPVTQVSSGTVRGRSCCLSLSEEGRVVLFNPSNARATYTADVRKYKFFAVGKEIRVAHTGSRLEWQRTGGAARYRNFPGKIDRVMLDGEWAAVFAEGFVWRMNQRDQWFKGPRLQADIADAALDGTTGDLHVVDSRGRLRIHRMRDLALRGLR